jgi:uncharacterized OsmC-like protein
MVEIDISYEGELRCGAVHGPSGDHLNTDAPADNHGRGEAFSPTDLVATALGSCMLTIMGIVAQHDGISLDGTRVRVRKLMSDDLPRRITRLEVELAVPLSKDHPGREKLEAAAMACPVKQSIHPDIAVPVNFQWNS